MAQSNSVMPLESIFPGSRLCLALRRVLSLESIVLSWIHLATKYKLLKTRPCWCSSPTWALSVRCGKSHSIHLNNSNDVDWVVVGEEHQQRRGSMVVSNLRLRTRD